MGSINYDASKFAPVSRSLRCWTIEELLRLITRRQQGIAEDSARKSCAKISSPLSRPHAKTSSSPRKLRGRVKRGSASGRRRVARRRILDQYTVEPDRKREGGQDRSGAGTRSRDPADRRHPDAAPAEQSHPDGRGGRRKDRGRRGLRPAHCAGGCAAAVAQRHRVRRSIWRCCRRVRASRANSKTG